jgi:hypothetical protein
MSELPGIYNFKDHYRGSTFRELSIKFNFDVTGAVITCQIRPQANGTIIHEWKTGVNITVNDLVTGDIVLQRILKFEPLARNYVYDLQILFADGTGDTYIKGTLKVIQDITETE